MATMSIAEALRQAIREEMERDSRVFCIGEDIGVEGGFGGAFTVTLGLSEEFGHERIMDTPISETGIAGVAIGAAMAGLRPIADVQYGDFLFCMMDQLVNQAAKMTYMSGGTVKVPMVMRAPVGSTRRGAQHAQSLEAFFTHIPGLKVVAPATAYDAKGLLKSAVRDDNPVLMFEHKLLYGSKGPRSEKGALSPIGEVPEGEYLVPIGKGIVRREGTDVTVIAWGTMVHVARAAIELSQIDAELIDLRTLLPLDLETITTSVRKTGRCIVVHEATRTSGFGAEVVALVQEHCFWNLETPIQRVTGWDAPFPHTLEWEYMPSRKRIVDAVQKAVEDT